MGKLASFVGAWLQGEVKLAPITELLGVEPVAIEDGVASVAMEVGERATTTPWARCTAASSATLPM